MTTNNSVNVPLSGSSGTGKFIGQTSPTITTPTINIINDSNGNQILELTPEASAVNSVVVTNNTATNPPTIGVAGSDTNISLELGGKGTGGIMAQASTSGSSVGSSYIGYTTSSIVTYASDTSYTSGNATTLTSLALTAGNWLLWGNVGLVGTTVTVLEGGLSGSTNTLPNIELITFIDATGTQGLQCLCVPSQVYNKSGSFTVYLVVKGVGTGTMYMFGGLYALRLP